MAEKLSINIDLRASRHVKQQPATAHNDMAHIKHADVPVEFSYRYDRMFTVTIFLILILIAIYYAVSAIFTESDNIQSARKNSAVQQIIKEKNLQISAQNNLQITAEINQRPVFLFYESIDVLETFHSEPVIEQTSSTEQIAKPENLALTSAGELSESDFEAQLPLAQITKSSSEISIPETVIHDNTSEDAIAQDIPEDVIAEAIPESVIAEVIPEDVIAETIPESVIAVDIPEDVIVEDISEDVVAVEIPEKTKAKYFEERPIDSTKEHDAPFIQIFSDKLSRVQLVSNIYKKEPVNKLSYWITGPEERAEKIFLFTQLNNSTGQMIEHQWWYQGEMLSNKKFTALGNRWRCYSSKNIGKFQQGKWMIKVLDQSGKLLSSVNFHYQIN